jgi:small subunit ribosomal protein S3
MKRFTPAPAVAAQTSSSRSRRSRSSSRNATRPEEAGPEAPREIHKPAQAEESLMGQKVNPIGLRLGVNRTWDSRWYASKREYGKLLQEDIKIRNYLMDKLKQAGVSRIFIERPHKKCRVTIHSARPGVVIGKKGADIEKLKTDLSKYTDSEVHLNIVEIRKPEIDAKLVADNIAQQLERRVAFRRAMKRAVQIRQCGLARKASASIARRLGGAEIARVEWYREGRVPLQILRADIDYGVATAMTTYGTCGVKVVFRAKSWSTTPWPRTSASMKRPTRQAAAGVRSSRLKGNDHASTYTHQIPQAAQGPHPRQCEGRQCAGFRFLRIEGGGTRARYGAPDRSGTPCADPPHEARGPGVDPHLS